MSVLLSVTFGRQVMNQIELVLVRDSDCYIISASDIEGPLHLKEFPFNEDSDVDQLRAAADATGWFDLVHETIEQYVSQSGSQTIRRLIDTLN